MRIYAKWIVLQQHYRKKMKNLMIFVLTSHNATILQALLHSDIVSTCFQMFRSMARGYSRTLQP